MSPAAALPMADQRRFGVREIAWWAVAAALVLGAHAAIAYAMQSWRPAEPDGGPPQAQVIELSPMAVTPAMPAPMPDEVVAPDQPDPVEEPETPETEPPPEPPVERAEPVAEPETAPADMIEPTPPTVAERVDQPPLEEVVPDVAEAATPDVVIPLPQPRPVDTPVETKTRKQAKAKVKEPAEKAKQRPKKEKAEPPRTTASVAAKPAARAAAPKSAKAAASSSGVSLDRWKSRMAAWIRRHTRYPRAAKARRAEGTVAITVRVSASGQVTSARISRSSGDADLDRAALSALQGAKVPAPPPELAGTPVGAPFLFNLRN